MISMLKNRTVLAVLALALLGLGCENATEPVARGAITVESSTSSLLKDTGDSALEKVEREVANTSEQVVTQLIDSSGGTLSLLGHDLEVPANAVSVPTYFIMIVLPGEEILVDLYAIDAKTGIDAGLDGFDKPVRLALSYAETGLTDEEAENLFIVHLLPDGTEEKQDSWPDAEGDQIEADLQHFSRYALCTN